MAGAGPLFVLGSLSLSADDSLLLSLYSSSPARLWDVASGEQIGVARRVAGSNLTADEWEQWGPRDTERYAVCPDYPLPGWGAPNDDSRFAVTNP